MRSQRRQRRKRRKRRNTGWEQPEEWLWAHLKGTCEKHSYDRSRSVWKWHAKPNGGEESVIVGIRKAKAYVEQVGKAPEVKPMPGRMSELVGWNGRM